MKFLSHLKNKDLANQTCLLRVDFNLTDDDLKKQKIPLRIKSVLPTIKFLIKKRAKVVILSHRGRPEKVSSIKYQVSNHTLKPFVKIISKILKNPVHFIDFDKKTNFVKTEDVQKIRASINGSIFILENLRFLPGEDKNDANLAKRLAGLGTFYVNDAFAFSHRKDASMVAITKFLPSYAGLLLEKEIKNLSRIMKNPKKLLVIILGGAKVSDKIGVIKNFLKEVKGQKSKINCFLTGGGVANTFFAAQGLPVGKSLYEKEMIPAARQLLKSRKIILPVDAVRKDKKILDIGPKTAEKYSQIIKKAGTIIWNGPMGYIEDPKFTKGSKAITEAILKSRAFAIVGGGETTSIISNFSRHLFKTNLEGGIPPAAGQFPISKKNIFISTGGGAMLEYLAGKKLPGLEALK